MKYYVLASGSKGNCTVVSSKDTTIAIDCGTTKQYLVNSFNSIGIDYTKLDGLLITHEHTDHIGQIKMFSMLDIYTPCEILSIPNERLVYPMSIFKIGCFSIMPIPLSHDTDIVVGYIIFDGEETLVYITDTGYVSHNNLEIIKNASYYILESNYDLEMLMSSRRPQYLKRRIVSDIGHMDNRDAGLVLSKCVGLNTKEIVLAHLSQECNTKEKALNSIIEQFNEFEIDTRKLKIVAAGQYEIHKGGN